MDLLCQLVPHEFNNFSIGHHVENAIAGENEKLKFLLLADYHIGYRYKSNDVSTVLLLFQGAHL